MQTATPIQHKTFFYRTFSEWLGGKAASVSSTGKPTFRVASPPEFGGEKNVWTPEDLFVGAIETCLLMTFASIARKRDLPVEAYYCESVGTLEYVDGGYRFTRVVVKPTIIVSNADAVQPSREAMKRAHGDCLVANSLMTTVIIEADVRLREIA